MKHASPRLYALTALNPTSFTLWFPLPAWSHQGLAHGSTQPGESMLSLCSSHAKSCWLCCQHTATLVWQELGPKGAGKHASLRPHAPTTAALCWHRSLLSLAQQQGAAGKYASLWLHASVVLHPQWLCAGRGNWSMELLGFSMAGAWSQREAHFLAPLWFCVL